MQKRWRKFLCRIGWHDLYVEYRSAPGLFTIDGKDVELSGTIERCEECWRTFFTYKDWPRMECHRESRLRSNTERDRQVFAMA